MRESLAENDGWARIAGRKRRLGTARGRKRRPGFVLWPKTPRFGRKRRLGLISRRKIKPSRHSLPKRAGFRGTVKPGRRFLPSGAPNRQFLPRHERADGGPATQPPSRPAAPIRPRPPAAALRPAARGGPPAAIGGAEDSGQQSRSVPAPAGRERKRAGAPVRRDAILNYLREHPAAKIDDVCAELGFPRGTVERDVRALKEGGLLRREGSPRSGTWLVGEPSD